MKMERYTDNELIEGIYNRDSHIVKFIMNIVWLPVKDFILSNNGSQDDVMQIMQEAILSIYSKKEKPQLACAFSTYFYSICKNMWLNELRVKKRAPVFSSEMAGLVQEDGIEEKILYEKRRQLYLKYYDKIAKICQDVLRLMSKGFSNEDITAELAFSSVQYTKNRKSICNKRLIDMIKSDPQYNELKYGL